MNDLRPVLIVEDSAQDVELTIEALKEHHLANPIEVCRDGAEALDYFYRRGAWSTRPSSEPLVVLLDLKMPKVDGLELLRVVKSDGVLKRIPIVVLTSSREEEDLVRSYELGVNAYVVKPVSFPDFVRAVKEVGAFWAVVNEPPPVRG